MRTCLQVFHRLAVLLIAALVVGCASAPRVDLSRSVLHDFDQQQRRIIGDQVRYDASSRRSVTASSGTALTPTQEQSVQDLMRKAYTEALQICNRTLTQYETKAEDAKKWMLGIATLGAAAGSVVVPSLLAKATAAKSTIAAWSGVAGATNFAQQAIVNVALDPNAYITTRAGVVQKVQEAITAFAAARGDVDKQYAAVATIEGACVAYAIASAPQQVNPTEPAALLPGAPTVTAVTPGAQSLAVSFNPPAADGGSPILDYTVTVTPAGAAPVQQTGTASPITVANLTTGTDHQVAVQARNRMGLGPPAFATSPSKPQ